MKDKIFKCASINMLLIWLGLFAILPIILILSLSFFSNDPKSIFSLPLTLSNFTILTHAFFYKIMCRSIILASIATFICFIIAYPFSYLLAQKKNTKLLLMLILIPFWTSSLIRTYAMVGLLKTNGILNSVLLKLHIINSPLDLLYNQTSVVIGLSYNLLPFMILPLYNTFDKFNNNLLTAAKDLNATSFYIFKTIIWPLSWPGVKNGLMMVLFPAMTIFYIPNILGGSKSLLLGNLIETQFFVLDNWPGGATSSFILSIIMMAGLYLTQYKRHKR